MIRKIFVSDMELCYKNIFEICNVTFIFQTFQIFFKHVKKIENKIHMDSESVRIYKDIHNIHKLSKVIRTLFYEITWFTLRKKES